MAPVLREPPDGCRMQRRHILYHPTRSTAKDVIEVLLVVFGGAVEERSGEEPFARQLTRGQTIVGRQIEIERPSDAPGERKTEIADDGRNVVAIERSFQEAQPHRRREELAERHADEDNVSLPRQRSLHREKLSQ